MKRLTRVERKNGNVLIRRGENTEMFTTCVDLYLHWFEPNFPQFILNIEKNRKNTHHSSSADCILRLRIAVYMCRQRMEVIFIWSSRSLSAKREHFGLIATELKNSCQIADVGKID